MLKRLFILVAGLVVTCLTTGWAIVKVMLDLLGYIDAASALGAKGGYQEKSHQLAV